MTRITSNLARPFSMIAKEQSSMMDHGVMDSILPFWMVRFATIVQSSFLSPVDSIVWIVRPLAVVSQTAMNHDLPSLWKSETVWAWYYWIASLVARNGSEMTCYWIAASEQWTIPNAEYSFSDVHSLEWSNQHLSNRFRWKDNASVKLHCLNSLVKVPRVLDNSR